MPTSGQYPRYSANATICEASASSVAELIICTVHKLGKRFNKNGRRPGDTYVHTQHIDHEIQFTEMWTVPQETDEDIQQDGRGWKFGMLKGEFRVSHQRLKEIAESRECLWLHNLFAKCLTLSKCEPKGRTVVQAAIESVPRIRVFQDRKWRSLTRIEIIEHFGNRKERPQVRTKRIQICDQYLDGEREDQEQAYTAAAKSRQGVLLARVRIPSKSVF
ncbi:hypothetical protein BKA93DRAFT_751878 [Sparassis latifolia]